MRYDVFAVDVQPVAQQHAGVHVDAYYRNYGEDMPSEPTQRGFLEVHVETKTYYSYLKQIFGCLLADRGTDWADRRRRPDP